MLGIAIGGVNVFFGTNDLLNFLIYSVIYSSGFFALRLGIFFSQKEKEEVIFQCVINVAIGYILLSIPRIFFIGLGIRTSIGFSFINSIVIYHKKPLFVFVFLFISATIFFLSGLRSVLILGIFTLFFSFYSRGIFSKANFKFLLILILAGLIGKSLLPNDNIIYTSIERSYYIFTKRMEQTLFNSDRIKVDPNGGRVDEAKDALDFFFADATTIDMIVGKGLGFSFQDHGKEQRNTAHTHITPVAYYIRNGIYGLLFYLYLLYKTFSLFLAYLLFRKKQKFMLSLSFSSFLWVFSSIFAGFLIDPMAWFIIGITTGFYKRKLK